MTRYRRVKSGNTPIEPDTRENIFNGSNDRTEYKEESCKSNGGLKGSSYQEGLLLEAFKSFQTKQPWDFEQIHNSDHGLCKWEAEIARLRNQFFEDDSPPWASLKKKRMTMTMAGVKNLGRGGAEKIGTHYKSMRHCQYDEVGSNTGSKEKAGGEDDHEPEPRELQDRSQME
ncbi:hypothetical protein PPACK8108_LOCUS14603 [Phakopsora pachyrhizi]|uniref:Uncharacterized protein n=1 Tax=Phakopsora pachyrhizi TaxID=170000 RepID=A0AAV0B559_PHAPC|nr:hypothetical protein PPACK8108_LOCUS14603 [Phakopsora pachyrhizi]